MTGDVTRQLRSTVAEASREAHVRRGLRLEYVTIAYNLLEGAGSLVAGWFAGSTTLVGFGLDSLLEVTSGTALVWRLSGDHIAERQARERIALRIVGVCFIALAAYVAFESATSLLFQKTAEACPWGIAIAIGSVVTMPILARGKRGVASGIASASLDADARQTELCSYLSAILLAGLGLNAAFGWWWADPVAGLVMVPIILKEGVEALRGRSCGCSGESACAG